MLERIAGRGAESAVPEEQLAEVRCARDELVVAERVVQRVSEQGFGEYASLRPPEGQVGPVGAVDPGPCRRRRPGRAAVGLPAHPKNRGVSSTTPPTLGGHD